MKGKTNLLPEAVLEKLGAFIQGKRIFILDSVLLILFLINMLLGYLLISNITYHPPVIQAHKYIDSLKTIQVEVLNGCGKKGLGENAISFFRNKKIDVIQSGNYISFEIPKTLVIDRVGSIEKAKIIASLLGVDSLSILRHYNKNYFLDVSVILGKDYQTLSLNK